MCNEPQGNIHLKPLSILLRPYGKPTSSVSSPFFVDGLRDVLIKLVILKLGPVL